MCVEHKQVTEIITGFNKDICCLVYWELFLNCMDE